MRMQAYRRSVAFDAMQMSVEPMAGGRYGEGRQGPRWSGVLLILGLHAAGLWALVAMDLVRVEKIRIPPTVVTLLPEAEPPPPAAPEPAPVVPSPVQVVAPPPLVQVAAPVAQPVRTVAVAPPPAPAAVAAPAAAPGPPVAAAVVPPDFSGDQLGNPAPRYPSMSRRLREQGTAVIRVTVGAGGRAGDCRVQRSSGHDRLDAAALETVCRWQFKPATRGGVAVDWPMDVPIPFVLRG